MNLPRIVVTVAERSWTPPDAQGVAVTEVASPPVTRRTVEIGFDGTTLSRRVLDLSAVPDAADVRLYGEHLFDALLGDTWPLIIELSEVKAARGVELALSLPDELHRPTWEAMHHDGWPLAAQPGLVVAITRLVPSDADMPARVGPPRALFASGADLTDPDVRPGAMFVGLLRQCESEGLAVTRLADRITLDQLERRCAEFQPDLVHLVAHGGLDEDGRPVLELAGTPVDGRQLVGVLTAGAHRPVAVVLSACYSADTDGHGRTASLAAELIAGGVPVVAAMAGEIEEPACRLFSRRFMRALLGGEAIAEAAAHGRRAALLAQPDPGTRLDWALPALFVADGVPPAFRPVDPEPAREVKRRANRLGLLQQPVYIGRRPIFGVVDTLFTPGRELGFVAATTQTGFSKLGATRLLREIGARLLQTGHVPLLLAPYTPQLAPRSLRHAIAEILLAVIHSSQVLDLPPPSFYTLPPPNLAGLPPAVVWSRLKQAVAAFRTGEDLDPQEIGDLLAADLDGLARAAATALGGPFGEHTRAVVLAEALHLWQGAMGWIESPKGFLDLLTPNGLGTEARPAPVIATASLADCAPLRGFREDRAGMSWCAFPDLGPLPDDEAALGYQWVLLQPWHPEAEYRKVYVAAPGHDQNILRERFRKKLMGQPAWVANRLYDLVDDLAAYGLFLTHDDEAAWHAYVKMNGLEPDR